MRKKNGRRLALHRETVKPLSPRTLDAAHGAATYGCSTRPICCTASDSCPPPPTGDCTTD